MSQYPSPYTPPNVMPYYGGSAEALKPAKKASILMFILGPMLLLCGGCMATAPMLFSMMPPDQLNKLYQQLQNPANISPSVILYAVGAIIIIPGIALIVLGLFVRKGGRVAPILSLVLVGLILVRFVIEAGNVFFHPIDLNIAMGLCMETVLHIPFVLLFIWLLNAARSASTIKLAQQQYQAQYMHYQQNMQAYMAYGQQHSPLQYAQPPYTQPPYAQPPYTQSPYAQQQSPQLPVPTQGYAQMPAQEAPPPPAELPPRSSQDQP